jgi:hypothetical protein
MYDCKAKEFFCVLFYKIVLMMKRIWRRIHIAVHKQDMALYMGIVVLWLLFAKLVNTVEAKDVSATYGNTLWEMKSSIFSSVVIAFAVETFNRIRVYGQKLRKQHVIYVELLNDLGCLIGTVADSPFWNFFHAFYNAKCFALTKNYLKERIADGEVLFGNEFLIVMDSIDEGLVRIRQEAEEDNLLLQDVVSFKLVIDEARKANDRMMLESDVEEFYRWLELLYEIVDTLRMPWRKDEKIDAKIIDILRRSNRNLIEQDFYKRMFLPDFGFDMIRRIELS